MLKIIPRDKFIVVLFFVAILSGLFFGSKMLGRPLLDGGNAAFYNNIANNILERFSLTSGKSDIMGAASEPFYPAFLSGIYILFGKNNFDAARIIQILLFAFTAIIIYLLANLACRQTGEITDNKIAMPTGRHAKIAGLFVALFFPLAASASEFTRETLFTFLITLLIYLLYKAQQTLKIKWFIFSGIILGLATLTNAIVQFFIIFAIFGFFLIFRRNFFRRDILLKIGAFVLFFILVVGSWSFRDFNQGPKALNLKAGNILSRKVEMIKNVRGDIYLRHLGGQFLGYYFFEKNGFNPSLLLGLPETNKKYREMIKTGENPEQVDEKFLEENMPVLIKNFPRYFAISFLDFLQFNGPMLPNPENLEAAPMQNLFIQNSHPGLPPIVKMIVLLGLRVIYWLFFGFVIYGLVKAIKDWNKFGWLILIILYFNLAYSATFGIPRYSIPVYPFYIVLFICGISAFLGRLKISKNININVA